MKASDTGEKPEPSPSELSPVRPPLASKREWLQLLACGVAIALLCVVWMFWA
ncbi:hypothetical protein BH11PSE3_BH11PSE3_39630 [soil metagenome]